MIDGEYSDVTLTRLSHKWPHKPFSVNCPQSFMNSILFSAIVFQEEQSETGPVYSHIKHNYIEEKICKADLTSST